MAQTFLRRVRSSYPKLYHETLAEVKNVVALKNGGPMQTDASPLYFTDQNKLYMYEPLTQQYTQIFNN